MLFPASGVRVSGFRMDVPTVTVRLVGASFWVEGADVGDLFERWGSVVSLKRGTSPLSVPGGAEGVWESGWVWSGEWVVRLKLGEGVVLPTFISAGGEVWDIRLDGSPSACFKCGDLSHLAYQCRAIRREEEVLEKREEEMGSTVEVFFLTKRVYDMSDEDFEDLWKKNVDWGNKVGVRNSNTTLTSVGISAGNEDTYGEELQNRRIVYLENKIKAMETDVSDERRASKITQELRDKEKAEMLNSKEKEIERLKGLLEGNEENITEDENIAEMKERLEYLH